MVGGANRCPLGATPLRAPRATGPLVPSWPGSPGRATSRWKRPMKCQRHEPIMSRVELRFQMKQDARNQGSFHVLRHRRVLGEPPAAIRARRRQAMPEVDVVEPGTEDLRRHESKTVSGGNDPARSHDVPARARPAPVAGGIARSRTGPATTESHVSRSLPPLTPATQPRGPVICLWRRSGTPEVPAHLSRVVSS